MHSFVPRSEPELLDGADARLLLLETYLDGWTNVAFATLLVYNSMINVDKEVKYFWTNPFSSVSLVYFMNRFLGLLGVSSILYFVSLFPKVENYFSFAHVPGEISSWIDGIAEPAIIVLIDYILTIRVSALYQKGRTMCIILYTLLGLEAVVGLGLLIYSGIGEPDAAFGIVGIGTACASNGGNPPELALIAGRVIPLLYGLLLLILATYKAGEYWKLSSGLKDFLLVRVIVRDQFIYYGSVIFVSISKIADIPISTKVPFVSEILDVSSSNILLCVLGGQLLINLKEVGEEDTDNGTDRTNGFHYLREITSVSTTFVLSSTCARDGVDAHLASLATGLSSDEEDALEDPIELARVGMSKLSMVSDALGRGLSVNVNGAPWKRVLMRMDEKPDGDGDEEAILVIYGLMPGRQYDVEVGVSFADGEEVLHSRMVTQAQISGQSGNDETADTSMESAASSFSVISNAASSPSGLQPINVQRPAITLEEYASQLRAQLAHLNQERDSLSSQLKAARKDAHKVDAMKRNEIDALKRAAEKHAATEVRGRQKMRALQEAAKQASAATRDADENAKELEASLPALREREKEVTARHENVAAEAARAESEAEEALAADRARTEALRNELSGLKTRLEKLQAKKARLSGETLPKIEKQLEGLAREVELVVRDVGAFEVVDNGPVGFDIGSRTFPGAPQHTPGRSPALSTSASVTPLGSPPAPIVRQAIQGTSRTSLGSSSASGPSALLSRATPFEPNPAITTRLAPAFQLQTSTSAANLRRANSLVQAQQPASQTQTQTHTQSQSVDTGPVGINVTAGNPAITALGAGPTRQSSLPMRMPSQPGTGTNSR
ncbi:hypothetical protein ACEPAF_2530 [Sanghuangporus sanghuang]